jgi:hypothetical protein
MPLLPYPGAPCRIGFYDGMFNYEECRCRADECVTWAAEAGDDEPQRRIFLEMVALAAGQLERHAPEPASAEALTRRALAVEHVAKSSSCPSS